MSSTSYTYDRAACEYILDALETPRNVNTRHSGIVAEPSAPGRVAKMASIANLPPVPFGAKNDVWVNISVDYKTLISLLTVSSHTPERAYCKTLDAWPLSAHKTACWALPWPATATMWAKFRAYQGYFCNFLSCTQQQICSLSQRRTVPSLTHAVLPPCFGANHFES